MTKLSLALSYQAMNAYESGRTKGNRLQDKPLVSLKLQLVRVARCGTSRGGSRYRGLHTRGVAIWGNLWVMVGVGSGTICVGQVWVTVWTRYGYVWNGWGMDIRIRVEQIWVGVRIVLHGRRKTCPVLKIRLDGMASWQGTYMPVGKPCPIPLPPDLQHTSSTVLINHNLPHLTINQPN